MTATKSENGDSHQIWRIQIIQVIAIDIHGTKGGKKTGSPARIARFCVRLIYGGRAWKSGPFDL